ncbi:MAG: signal peptidase II [Alkaliphilus sp.]
MNFILIIIILALDKITKLLAIEYLQPIRTLPIIEDIFHLTYLENRGAAFGILQGQRIFFLIATTVVVIAIVIFMYKFKKMHRPMKLGLNLIVAGAIGNLIDRIRFGFVVDFFDFRIWPVFNIADSAVVVGAILVSYIVLKHDHFEPKEM